MRTVAGRVLIGLLLAAAAMRAESACSIKKGLYEQWGSLSKRASGRKNLKETPLRSGAGSPGPEKQAIEEEYREYFRCLAESPIKVDEQTPESFCDPAAGDRLAFLVCQCVRHLKTGRTSGKDFINAFPASRKGTEMIWDLEEIVGAPQTARLGAIFQPEGPAIKLIDELFLLVLDDKESAAARYFSISASATGDDAKHMDQQIKVLLAESPAVVVKQWPTLRQYQSTLKRVIADMAASLPKAEMAKTRRQAAAFCPRDNLDCPEILKLFGSLD